jgi:excisionase family DNA binding protein
MDAINTKSKIEAASPAALKPEWIRPKEVTKYFGMGRSRVYDLISNGSIKSVSLRQRGQKHGTRLISYDSLAAYLNNLAEGGEQ